MTTNTATATTAIQSCEDALNRLTATVNGILIESGQFFRASGSMQSQMRLRRAVPAANEEFQTALDYLSEQIFLAKAVLERDYEAAKSTEPKTSITPERAILDQKENIVSKSVEQPVVAVAQGTSSVAANQVSTDPVTNPNDLAGQGGEKPPQQQSLPDLGAAPNVPVAVAKDIFPIQSKNPAGLEAANNGSQPALDIPTSPPKGTAPGAGTLPSVLPGSAEFSANASAGDPSTAKEQTGSKPEEKPSDVPMEDVPPAESNFDNMFIGADFGDGEDLLDVEIGELDESWFM